MASGDDPDFQTFEYEQCPGGRELALFKFDHTPQRDSRWHRVNASAEAHYRYAEGYFQLVRVDDDHVLAGVLALIERRDR
jgi:hypothetical protein